MSKWIKKLRALPSDPSADDYLKIEYLEVNLNNSRKLIALVRNTVACTKELANEEQNIVGTLLPLRSIRNELSWLDTMMETALTETGKQATCQDNSK